MRKLAFFSKVRMPFAATNHKVPLLNYIFTYEFAIGIAIATENIFTNMNMNMLFGTGNKLTNYLKVILNCLFLHRKNIITL